MRPITKALLAGFTLLVATGHGASAVTGICRDLEARLSRGSADSRSTLTRSYDRAVDQQQQELSNALRRAQRLGCGDYGVDARCGALEDTIARMESNLSDLVRTQRRLARSEGGGGRTRQRLLARLEAYGCRDGDGGEAQQARRRPPVEDLNPRSRQGAREDEQQAALGSQPENPVPGPTPQSSAAAYRTLCVRTCDGYFFPMSYAAGESDFSRDQAACQSACPGTEVKLYVYRTADQEPESMVSAAGGAPYRDLPTAFRYRDAAATKTEGCSCQAKPRNFSVVAGPVGADEPVLPLAPTTKPIAQEPATGTAKAAAGKPEDRKVRVVAPSFLPDPAAAIDLQAPVPKPAP